MFEQAIVIEAGENYIVRHERLKWMLRHTYKSFRWNFDMLNDIHVNLNSKKVCVILNEEQLQIKLMTLPKTNPENLKHLIRNELFYSFKEAENMSFSYEILKESNSNFELIVYATSCNNLKLAERYLSSKARITGVYLIQFCLLECYKKKLKNKSYFLFFNYMGSLYLMCCYNHQLFHNKIVKRDEGNKDFTSIFNDFLNQIKFMDYKEPEVVYFANFSSEEFKQVCIEDIACENLGEINHKHLMKIVRDKKGKTNA
jgi:hypothetical protein